MARVSLRGVLLPAPEHGEEGPPVPAREVFALLATLRPGRSLMTRAENLYVAVFTAAVIVGLTWTISRRVGTLFADVASFYHFVWGTPLVLLIFLGVFRYSTVQGFVSFSEADCFYLLPAPLGRRALVRPRLVTATVLLGIAGAVAGILVTVASHGPRSGERVGEAALAGLALGILLVAGSWQVQRLRWATAWVMRLTIPLLAVALLLAIAQTQGRTAKLVGLWSGPWGWGILPLTAGAPRYTIAALGLLCALALAAAVSLYRTAGQWTLEGFRVRARTRSQVVASLYAFDYRAVGQAARTEKSQTWQGRLRLPVPRRDVLTVPWHGAVSLLRSPVRLGWAVVLAGAGVYLLALQPLRQGALWAGAVALYLAASSLLEPLRLEVNTPGAAKMHLPWRFEKVMWLHCLLPAAVIVVAGLLSLAGGLAAGFLTGHAVVTLVILILPLTFLIVLAAGLSARRGGRVSNNLVNLAAMDTTGFSVIFVIMQLALWAIISIAATVAATWVLGRDQFAFRPVLILVFALLAAVAVAMQRGMVTKPSGETFWERLSSGGSSS